MLFLDNLSPFFSLPDKNARLEILKIHTSSWGANRPSDNVFKWLSERTSGYCGADLKVKD